VRLHRRIAVDLTSGKLTSAEPHRFRHSLSPSARMVPGVSCPAPASDHQLTVLKISSGNRPSITLAWCGKVSGAGPPIVTTSDGTSDPVARMVGAEGDNRLHGFRGDTGEPLFSGGAGPAMMGLRHFQTLIGTRDRLYAGADGQIYAFAF
jgi:hypothetical protein